MKSVFNANDNRGRSIDEMNDIAFIDVEDDENDSTVVRPAVTPECHNQKSDDADSERGVFDYFNQPTRPAYPGSLRTSHLAATTTDNTYLGPRYATSSVSNPGTKKFIDARHRGCEQTDVVQARTAQVSYGDSHDRGTAKFPGWPKSRSFPTPGDAAGSLAAKTTDYLRDRDSHVMSSSLSYSSKYQQYSEHSEFDSYDDMEDIQSCNNEKQLKQNYSNKETKRLNTAKSDEAFSVSDSQASDSDDSSREPSNHEYRHGTSAYKTAGKNGPWNVDRQVCFPLNYARSANDSSTVRSNVRVADDCAYSNFVTYSDRSAVTSSFGASARPVYVTEGSRTMTSAPTSDWRNSSSQDDRRWMDSASADEESHSNHVVPARVFPQSHIVCPQYQLISDDHRRYTEDDIDYESRMASQKSAQQLEKMQRRRQAKMEKQSAGFCAADDVPGYRGKDPIDDLISYIDPSLCDNKIGKKQSKKKKKSSTVAVNSLLAESVEKLGDKSTQAKACKSSDEKTGLHANQYGGEDLVLDQSTETEFGHDPVSASHEGVSLTECLNFMCDVSGKRIDKLDTKSCGDEIVDQGTFLQSDLVSRCSDENAVDVDHVSNSSSVLGQNNDVSECNGVENLMPLTSSIGSSSQLQDVCDSDSSLCSSGIQDAAFITVQKKKRAKHSAGSIAAIGPVQNAQDKIADSNGELNQLKNLVDNLHIAGACKSMSTVSDSSSRQYTSKVAAGPVTTAAGVEARAEQSFNIRPYRDNSSLKASQSRSISSKDAKTLSKSRQYQNVDRIAESGTSITYSLSSKVNDVKAFDQNEALTESCSLSNAEFPVLSESKSVPNPSVHVSNAVPRTKSAHVNLVKSTAKTMPQDALSLLNTEPMGLEAPSAGRNQGLILSSNEVTNTDSKLVNEKMHPDMLSVLPDTAKQTFSVDGVMPEACSATGCSVVDNSASVDPVQSVGDVSGDSQIQMPAVTVKVTSADLQTALSKPAVSDVKFGSKQRPTESSSLQSAASNRPTGESVVFLDTQNPNCLLSPPRCDISFGFEIETDLLQSVLPADIQPVSMTEPVQLPEDQQPSVLTTSCQEVEPLDIVASSAVNCIEPMAPAISGPVLHYLPGCPTVLYCMHPAFQTLTYQYLPPQGALFHVNRCTPIGVVPPMPSEVMTPSLPPTVVEINDSKSAESFASLTDNELLKSTCASPFDLTAAQIFLYSEYMKASESTPTVHYRDKPLDN